MKEPPVWSLEELRRDAEEATNRFRNGRLADPLRELYGQRFDDCRAVFEELLQLLARLQSDEGPAILSELLSDPKKLTAFRYLSAPPISVDDLKTLARTSLAPTRLRKDIEASKRVRDVVLSTIDSRRFPWIIQGRPATAREVDVALSASAALVATKQIETARRSSAKTIQEELVKGRLRTIGFGEVPPRKIDQPHQAPAAGEFCAESAFGPTRADIVVRLHDQRIMPIECKVSNSEVNSFKRVNHEAAGKASRWLTAFGRATTVPAAVLSGVFKPDNLLEAQNSGLCLFWAHRLEDLEEFLIAAA